MILASAKKQRLIADNYASADYISFPKRPRMIPFPGHYTISARKCDCQPLVSFTRWHGTAILQSIAPVQGPERKIYVRLMKCGSSLSERCEMRSGGRAFV